MSGGETDAIERPDLTTETERPFIIRTLVRGRVINQYVPMASIEECREFIAMVQRHDADRRTRREAEKLTAEYRDYARQVLEATGYDPMTADEPTYEYVVCRISYEVVD